MRWADQRSTVIGVAEVERCAGCDGLAADSAHSQARPNEWRHGAPVAQVATPVTSLGRRASISTLLAQTVRTVRICAKKREIMVGKRGETARVIELPALLKINLHVALAC